MDCRNRGDPYPDAPDLAELGIAFGPQGQDLELLGGDVSGDAGRVGVAGLGGSLGIENMNNV